MKAHTTEQDKAVANHLPRSIAYIHHGQVPGGAPTSLRTLIEGIRQEAPTMTLDVWCVFPQMMPFFREVDGVTVRKYVETPVQSGKKLIGWNPLFQLKTLTTLFRQIVGAPGTIAREVAWMLEQKPDIVHLNSATLWTSAIAARRAGIPLVWHVRETIFGSRWNLRKRLYGSFLRKMADAVIAISPEDAASLGADAEGKVSVVYNSVDLAQFDPALYDVDAVRASFGIPKTAVAIVTLGGLSPRKGAWQLLSALKALPSSHHLIIAGGKLPNSEVKITTWKRLVWAAEDVAVRIGLLPTHSWRYADRVAAEAKGITGRVHSVGVVSDVARLLSACDILVFAGTIPHFARPIYEAWAMDKPVIAFDTPVMRAEIDPGVDGLLVPRQDPQALATAIMRLSENPDLARGYGRRGRAKAVERFDRTKNTRKVLEIYRSLTSSPLNGASH